MPIPSTMTDLSVTAASNSPSGSDTPSILDDMQRAQGAIIRREQSKATPVASATTVDLGAVADGNYVHVTGTTTITSFGTVAAGISRIVVFDGALTLTHNATSLILPGGASITTAAGDSLRAVSEGSGNWKVVWYQKASGQPVSGAFTYTVGTAANNLVQLNGSGQLPAVDGSQLTGVSSLPTQTGNNGKVLVTNGTSASWGNSTGVTTAQSMVRVQTANPTNPYGSTNTMIRRFVTTVTSQGSDITYADSAANGNSFTINTTGVYSITYSDVFSAARHLGVSRNGTQLSTSIAALSTGTEFICGIETQGANAIGTASVTIYLTAGDVIRAHTDGGGNGSPTYAAQFTIARVS